MVIETEQVDGTPLCQVLRTQGDYVKVLMYLEATSCEDADQIRVARGIGE